MKLTELVAGYCNADTLPPWMVIDDKAVMACLRKAVRLYCGYAKLASTSDEETHTNVSASDAIDDELDEQNFDLTPSEFALISPIFHLYVERMCAVSLEASRGLGVDVYGRMTSEIAQDIQMREEELPRKAFIQFPFTV